MWSRADLKFRGKMAFKRNYWPSVLVALIMGIFANAAGLNIQERISERKPSEFGSAFSWMFWTTIMVMIGLIAVVFFVLSIFVGNVLLVGGCRFFIVNQVERPTVGVVTSGFSSGKYGNIVLTMFLKDLFTGLWSLLFVIPGIIKSYEYRMIPYILAENPGMHYKEAFQISKNMMMGRKLDTFVLDLSFIGWEILSAITWGIVGLFYVDPYREATMAELYAENRAKAYQEGYIH